ncbi:MAG: type III-B CRISPR module RAMP protein Cmr1, partial [Candidatus Desantisbacteria bacterium]
ETGIIGSLRWWYEAIVRGLGGYACDPTGNNKCEFNTKAYEKAKKDRKSIEEAIKIGLADVCPACELFGCTGWGRKVKVNIDDSGIERNPTIKNNVEIGREGIFIVQLHELKKITDEEKWLMHNVFYLIDKYGTIGGKCMLKPSNSSKSGKYCEDKGQVKVIWEESDIGKPNIDKKSFQGKLFNQKQRFEKNGRQVSKEWPDLRYFIFSPENSLDASKYIKLQDFPSYSNFLKGEKGEGKKQAKANKFASFKNEKRFWGYTKVDDTMFNQVLDKLDELGLTDIKKGSEVIENEL